MTITLLEDVTSSQGLVAVSNPTETRLDAVLQIEDELVVVRNRPRDGGKLVLGRGVLGTVRAAHASGATLVAYEPDTSGGSLSVDNGVDPPSEVATLVAPGAVIVGDSASIGAGVWCGTASAQLVDGDDTFHHLTNWNGTFGARDISLNEDNDLVVDLDGAYLFRALVHVEQAPGAATYRKLDVRRSGLSVGYPTGNFTGMTLTGEQFFTIEVPMVCTAGDVIALRASHDAGEAHTFTVTSFLIQRLGSA